MKTVLQQGLTKFYIERTCLEKVSIFNLLVLSRLTN